MDRLAWRAAAGSALAYRGVTGNQLRNGGTGPRMPSCDEALGLCLRGSNRQTEHSSLQCLNNSPKPSPFMSLLASADRLQSPPRGEQPGSSITLRWHASHLNT